MINVFYRCVAAVLAFIVTYIALCYVVPGWRIKLEAEPLAYFKASLKHMMVVKLAVSASMGLLAAGLPRILKRR